MPAKGIGTALGSYIQVVLSLSRVLFFPVEMWAARHGSEGSQRLPASRRNTLRTISRNLIGDYMVGKKTVPSEFDPITPQN